MRNKPLSLPSAGASWSLAIALALVASVAGLAQRPAPSGEELYVDRLGCWNCHGRSGEGGPGRAIAKTALPLRKFVKYVRLPSETMPPVAPVLASDRDLAVLYRWLDGVEATHTPPSITFSLRSSAAVRADGQSKADVLVEVTARAADPSRPDLPAGASLRYRITLAQAQAPAAHRTIECQRDDREEWSPFTTDEHGEALLGPDRGFVLARAADPQEPTPARLRMALTAGRYALLIEAIDRSNPGSPIVAGIGTAILNVE